MSLSAWVCSCEFEHTGVFVHAGLLGGQKMHRVILQTLPKHSHKSAECSLWVAPPAEHSTTHLPKLCRRST